MACELCTLTDCKYKIVICDSCQTPMLVLIEHRPEFTDGEKEEIKSMFPNSEIRFKMRKVLTHAHCHLE